MVEGGFDDIVREIKNTIDDCGYANSSVGWWSSGRASWRRGAKAENLLESARNGAISFEEASGMMSWKRRPSAGVWMGMEHTKQWRTVALTHQHDTDR